MGKDSLLSTLFKHLIILHISFRFPTLRKTPPDYSLQLRHRIPDNILVNLLCDFFNAIYFYRYRCFTNIGNLTHFYCFGHSIQCQLNFPVGGVEDWRCAWGLVGRRWWKGRGVTWDRSFKMRGIEIPRRGWRISVIICPGGFCKLNHCKYLRWREYFWKDWGIWKPQETNIEVELRPVHGAIIVLNGRSGLRVIGSYFMVLCGCKLGGGDGEREGEVKIGVGEWRLDVELTEDGEWGDISSSELRWDQG